MASLVRGPGFDFCLAQRLAESIGQLKAELVDINRGLSSLESDDATLTELAVTIRNALSNSSLRYRRIQFDQASSATLPTISRVKFPKLEVPTFDGNLMNRAAFWECLDALIHCRKGVDDAENLTYLRQAFKDGSARHVIGGLSQTAKNYEQAVKCSTSAMIGLA